ncbi:MAG: sulfatase [Gemmatimonadaceae bacterium]|nr:sulfatase [Gemmatimonadaceae bacterium]
MIEGSQQSGSRLAAATAQFTFYAASALLGAFLTLSWAWVTRPGFSIFRWGWDSRDVAWMAPLGYLTVFAPFALLAILVAVVLHHSAALRIGLALWITLITFSFLLLYPAIHGYASLILSLAVGVQLSGVLARRERSTLIVARVASCVLGLAAIAGYFTVTGGRRRAEASALAALPAAAGDAPNVLLIILDTVRAQSLSLYGFDKPTTPWLVEWAKRGVVFEEAYATAPWTLPSHASMFTGKYASAQSGSWVHPVADSETTIAEVFRAHGYATSGFTANLVATRYESGLGQGFIRYEDLKTTPKEVVLSSTITQSDNLLRFWDRYEGGWGLRNAFAAFRRTSFQPKWTDLTHHLKSAEEVTTSFLAWRETLGAGRPYFTFLNYFDAHAPYDPPEPYYSMFGKPPSVEDRYLGGIRYMDDQLHRLFAALEVRGDLVNTVLIVTADHGEQFGEHGLSGHDNSLYRQVIRVPLLVWYPPRVPGGRRIDRPASIRDIAATLIDLAGVPRDSAIQGTSLAAAWSDISGPVSTAIAEVDKNMRPSQKLRNAHGDMKAVINDTAHVIRDGDGKVEAYEYRVDPLETNDLGQVKAVRDSFGAVLDRAIAANALRGRKLAESKGSRAK